VAIADAGEIAFELIGAIQHDDAGLTGCGFLTRVRGIDDGSMFGSGDRSASNARLTFLLRARVTPSSAINGVTTLSAAGSLAVYLARGGKPSFDHPASFQTSSPVGIWDAQVQAVFMPGAGTSEFAGDLVQRRAYRISAGGRHVAFGRVGAVERLWLAGTGAPTTADLSHWAHRVAGNVIVTSAGRP
jgi:hypothetical protein